MSRYDSRLLKHQLATRRILLRDLLPFRLWTMFGRFVTALRKPRNKRARGNVPAKSVDVGANKLKASSKPAAKTPRSRKLLSSTTTSPLESAVLAGNQETARRLLEGGEEAPTPNTRPDSKYLLHIAEMGHREVAEEPLKAGADVNATTLDGQTPLYVARRHKQYKTGALIGQHGGKHYSPNATHKPRTT